MYFNEVRQLYVIISIAVLQEDADEFLTIAKELNDGWTSALKADSLDENLLRLFAYCSAGDICPMQAIIGGITAQEVMKVGLLIYMYYISRYCIGNIGVFSVDDSSVLCLC